MSRRALNGANHDDGDGDKLAADVVTARRTTDRTTTSSAQRHDDDYQPLADHSSSSSSSSCTLRSVFIALLVLALGIGMGTLGDMGYDRYIVKHSNDDNPSTDASEFIDPHMKQFWLLENLPSVLYYNHSTLANTTLFPRSDGVTWNSLSSPSVQLTMVERAIWVMDQLMLPRYQPAKYFSAPGWQELSWQADRVTTLKKLRARYINKLAAVRNGTIEPLGLIPKWYTPVDSRMFLQGVLPRSLNLYLDTRWSSVAYHPRYELLAMGSEVEANAVSMTVSQYLGTEAGEHQLGLPVGMNITNHTHAWVASILTKEGSSDIAYYIRESKQYTDQAKAAMISRIMSFEMGQMEAQIIRLARAYSHDRANLIAEGSLKVIFDRVMPLSRMATAATTTTTSKGGPIAYGSDSTLRRQCLRLSSTPDELMATMHRLRNGDVLRYNDNHYGIIHTNATGIYLSGMILSFNHNDTHGVTGGASRQLRMRRVNTWDMMDMTTNDTTIAALHLQGWSSWTNRTDTSTTQVWGRVAVAPDHNTLVDATQLVANGEIRTWDMNNDVSYDSNECGGYSGVFDFCGRWNVAPRSSVSSSSSPSPSPSSSESTVLSST